MAKKVPRFYFSLRSPYSWLAYGELWRDHADVARRLEFVPFYEPDELSTSLLAQAGAGQFPYSEMSRAKNMYVLQDIGRITKARGVPITWPVDRDPVWEVPHLGYLLAADQGLGQEYIAGIYQARFGAGKDICDPATVAEAGRALGLDPRRLASAAEDPALRARGVQCLLEVIKDGVFGVPFFVHGFSRYWGIDRLAEFAAHLRTKLPADSRPPESLAGAVGLGRSADDGHAGGCG